MWLEMLSDPMILIAFSVFVLVVAYFYWLEKKEKERKLEERLKRLEEQQKEKAEKGER